MRNEHTSKRPARPESAGPLTIAGAAALALLAGALAGCGDSNEGGAAVKQAADSLQALHAGGADLPPPQVRRAVYERVGAQSQRAQGQAGVSASAAAGLAAQATAGLADLALADAARIEADLRATADRLRADFDFRQAQSALADALEQQAAGVNVAVAEELVARLEQELAEATDRIADLEAQVNAIEAQATAANEQARSIRAEEGRLRAQALAVQASEKAALLQQAFEVQRRADAREEEASKLTARAASIKPLLKEAQQVAMGVETRLSLARRSQAALADRRARLAADAADARASARAAAERVAETIEEIMSARRGSLAQAYQTAAEQLERAIANYSRAGREGDASARSTAAIRRGVATQRLGEAMAGRIANVSMLESLLRVVQQAQPTFEPAQPVDAAMMALGAERAASAQAAATALADAVEAYEAALRGLPSDDRAQVEALAARLRARIAELAGADASAEPGAN